MDNITYLQTWLDLHQQNYAIMRNTLQNDEKIAKSIAKYQLTEYESVALRYYTDWGYEKLNAFLRKPQSYADVKWLYLQNIKVILNQALQKLPPFSGLVLRYVSLPDVQRYEVGEIITYPEFISTTKSNVIPAVGQFAAHKLVIKSYSGREIAWISEQPDEQEVLFMTDSSFLVINKKQDDDLMTIIMEELP